MMSSESPVTALRRAQWLHRLSERYDLKFILVVGLSTALVFLISSWFELGDRFFIWAEEEHEAIELDEAPFAVLWLVWVVLGWLSHRRLREYRTEVMVREQELAKRKALTEQLAQNRDKLEELIEERTQELQDEIAHRLRAEQQVQAKQAQLAHVGRLNLLGEMAASLAHEVNQPLFALSNYAKACVQRMKSGDSAHEEITKDLNHVLDQAKRATEIVRRARNFARRDSPKWIDLDVNTAIREVVDLLEFEARTFQVKVDVDLAEILPPVTGDNIQIQQVIVNLARNGMEAMAENGVDSRRLKIRTISRDHKFIEITVEDSGPGLAPGSMDDLFEPFRTTKPQGLGMGLAISRSIAEEHGGKIWLRSNGEAGTAFHFALPVSEKGGPGEP